MSITVEFLTANRQRAERVVEVSLGYRETYRPQGDLRGAVIVPVEGQIWVTQAGDPRDHTLGPGERLALTHRGSVVIQGMGAARFHFVRS